MKAKFFLRKVNKSDAKLLLDWSNDLTVRRWSFNKKPISLLEHKKYLKNFFNKKNFIMWIFLFKKKPCGLVKIKKYKRKAILSYLISGKYRGKKLASIMLSLANNKLCKKFPKVSIYAHVLTNNSKSIKSLVRAGFVLKSSKKNKKIYIHQCI